MKIEDTQAAITRMVEACEVVDMAVDKAMDQLRNAQLVEPGEPAWDAAVQAIMSGYLQAAAEVCRQMREG